LAAAYVLTLLEFPDQFQTFAPRLVPSAASRLLPPPLPAPRPLQASYWLDQNWSETDRRWFHHASQGTETFPIPYAWFVALEQPYVWLIGQPELFKDQNYLKRFGFIPSPKTDATDDELRAFGFRKGAASAAPIAPSTSLKWSKSENDDGLPVGFARMKDPDHPDDKASDRIGLTCAACHTGHVEYNGVSLRIDGGAAMVDLERLKPSLALALLYTLKLPHRFDRFAARVLGPGADEAQLAVLETAVTATLSGIVAERDRQDVLMALARQAPTIEGNGRLDAINRIGNQVFYSDMAKAQLADQGRNFHANDAPVRFPQVWNVPWFLWAQYDASIEHPLIRNAGEALGVTARVDLASGKESPTLFRSSVNFPNLLWIEDLLRGPDPFAGPAEAKRTFGGLTSPKWPSALFPDDPAWKIDPQKAAKGRALYAELCAGCHLGPIDDPEFDRLYPDKRFWTSKHWAPEGDKGGKVLIPPQIPVKEIGTDPARADVLVHRTVETPAALDIDPRRDITEKWSCDVALPSFETRTIPFAYALMVVVDRVAEKWMKDNNISATDRKAIIGWRKNCPNKQSPVYRTRPLNGVWATAPYLHNGSVPSLYWLLKPAAERPRQFCFGARDFDPKIVGFAIDGDKPACAVGETLFSTTDAAGKPINGNSTAGHSLEDGARAEGSGVIGRGLTEDERFQLIEYLKTL
jgi:mono/diheme cytochrome c family protein